MGTLGNGGNSGDIDHVIMEAEGECINLYLIFSLKEYGNLEICFLAHNGKHELGIPNGVSEGYKQNIRGKED